MKSLCHGLTVMFTIRTASFPNPYKKWRKLYRILSDRGLTCWEPPLFDVVPGAGCRVPGADSQQFYLLDHLVLATRKLVLQNEPG